MAIRITLLACSILWLSSCGNTSSTENIKVNEFNSELNAELNNVVQVNAIQVGAQQFSEYLPLLIGKRVGLVVNQTSTVNNLTQSTQSNTTQSSHLVDTFLAKKIDVKAIFAPEHGFRGDHDAGEKFTNGIDKKTGVPLVSIYGKSRKPAAETMAELDVIVFDIQDVGVRFYTYISSMHYMMEAAADAGIPFIVLDRPNPNGRFVDGPILEKKYTSFVGMHQIPLVHGMTIGELAKMFVGEQWLQTENALELYVVSVKHYQRDMFYSLPIKPSPNLPNDAAIALYPSLGFFEATPLSIGRGTNFPFQVIGHNKVHKGNFEFMPISKPGSASKPVLMGELLKGQDLRNAYDFSNTINQGIHLSYVIDWYKAFKAQNEVFFTRPQWMDKLSGTDTLRKAIIAGKSEAEIKQSWQAGLTQFKQQRKPYLLYKD